MCVCAQVLNDGHKFFAGGYGCPEGEGDIASCVNQITTLPRTEAPEVFGLHSNAAIAFNLQVGKGVCVCVSTCV
jgi:dynein heavy chain